MNVKIVKDENYISQNTYAWQTYHNAEGKLSEERFYKELDNLIV